MLDNKNGVKQYIHLGLATDPLLESWDKVENETIFDYV